MRNSENNVRRMRVQEVILCPSIAALKLLLLVCSHENKVKPISLLSFLLDLLIQKERKERAWFSWQIYILFFGGKTTCISSFLLHHHHFLPLSNYFELGFLKARMVDYLPCHFLVIFLISN